LNRFVALNNYLIDLDFFCIQLKDVSLVECAVLPVELKKLGLKIIYKKIRRRNF
jgi:hypothetical protein